MASCVQRSVLQVLGRSWRPVYNILLPHFVPVEFHIGISFVRMGGAPPPSPRLSLTLSLPPSLHFPPSLSLFCIAVSPSLSLLYLDLGRAYHRITFQCFAKQYGRKSSVL